MTPTTPTSNMFSPAANMKAAMELAQRATEDAKRAAKQAAEDRIEAHVQKAVKFHHEKLKERIESAASGGAKMTSYSAQGFHQEDVEIDRRALVVLRDLLLDAGYAVEEPKVGENWDPEMGHTGWQVYLHVRWA